jgi:Icc-related predicted phosphoesterase
MRIIKIQTEVAKRQASILLNNHTPPRNILADQKMRANNQIGSNRVKKI